MIEGILVHLSLSRHRNHSRFSPKNIRAYLSCHPKPHSRFSLLTPRPRLSPSLSDVDQPSATASPSTSAPHTFDLLRHLRAVRLISQPVLASVETQISPGFLRSASRWCLETQISRPSFPQISLISRNPDPFSWSTNRSSRPAENRPRSSVQLFANRLGLL